MRLRILKVEEMKMCEWFKKLWSMVRRFCLIRHICRLKGEILSYVLFSAGIMIPLVMDNKLTWQIALSLSASFAGVLLGIYNYQLSKERKRQERLRQLIELSKR